MVIFVSEMFNADILFFCYNVPIRILFTVRQCSTGVFSQLFIIKVSILHIWFGLSQKIHKADNSVVHTLLLTDVF